jgi:diguanylate cyclase (GGDEF)-like protein
MRYDNKLITPENRNLIAIISSIVLILVMTLVANLFFHDLIQKVELKSFDWRVQIAANNVQNTDEVVILVVDDISLQNAVSHPELGLSRWPWPRSVHGHIVNYMKKAGAKLVVFDIIFEGSEGVHEANKLSDQFFFDAVREAQNVIFATSFTYSNRSLENYKNKEQIKENILKISAPELKEEIKRFSIDSYNIDFLPEIKNNIEFYNVSNVMQGLLQNARSLGSVTLPASEDGIIRSTRPLVFFQDRYYPSLPLAVYLTLNPDKKVSVKKDEMLINDKAIPLTEEGGRYINWYGPTGTFKHYRALDVILEQMAYTSGQMEYVNNEKFKDKIVIVGLTAAATDILPTPMNDAYPGPEIVATAVNNYMNSDKFISKFGTWKTLFLSFILSLVIGINIFMFRSGILSILISLLIIGCYIYATIHFFVHSYLWIDMIFPSFIMFFTIMTTFMSKYVTTRKAFEDTYQLATTDGLTGLFNHRYFQETMNQTLKRAERYDHDVSLILVDIDFFKMINDTYGHRAGDQVLKEISTRIKSVLRTTDIVARYGGEEIAIILDNTGYENAFIAAHKVLKEINSKQFSVKSGLSIPVTASLGIAAYPKHGEVPSELIETADQALYFAKENGRNRIGSIEEKTDLINQQDIQVTLKKDIDLHLKITQDQYDLLLEQTKLGSKEELTDWIIQQLKAKEASIEEPKETS